MIIIFDLGFSECGAAGNAPIHGFFTAVNETLLDNVCKQTQLISFVFLVECEVGVVPVTEHSESLELGSLMINVLACVRFTFEPDFCGTGISATGLA